MTSEDQVSGLESHLGYWMRYVSNHVSYAFGLKVELRGVTIAEWAVLREVFDAGPVNPSVVAEKLGMTRGAISKLVDRLCHKKLATRTHSKKDRRFQTIALTAAGRRLVPQLAELADENDRHYFGHLTGAQQTELAELLRAMVRRHGWKDVPLD